MNRLKELQLFPLKRADPPTPPLIGRAAPTGGESGGAKAVPTSGSSSGGTGAAARGAPPPSAFVRAAHSRAGTMTVDIPVNSKKPVLSLSDVHARVIPRTNAAGAASAADPSVSDGKHATPFQASRAAGAPTATTSTFASTPPVQIVSDAKGASSHTAKRKRDGASGTAAAVVASAAVGPARADRETPSPKLTLDDFAEMSGSDDVSDSSDDEERTDRKDLKFERNMMRRREQVLASVRRRHERRCGRWNTIDDAALAATGLHRSVPIPARMERTIYSTVPYELSRVLLSTVDGADIAVRPPTPAALLAALAAHENASRRDGQVRGVVRDLLTKPAFAHCCGIELTEAYQDEVLAMRFENHDVEMTTICAPGASVRVLWFSVPLTVSAREHYVYVGNLTQLKAGARRKPVHGIILSTRHVFSTVSFTGILGPLCFPDILLAPESALEVNPGCQIQISHHPDTVGALYSLKIEARRASNITLAGVETRLLFVDADYASLLFGGKVLGALFVYATRSARVTIGVTYCLIKSVFARFQSRVVLSIADNIHKLAGFYGRVTEAVVHRRLVPVE